jgi:hypothetical protein
VVCGGRLCGGGNCGVCSVWCVVCGVWCIVESGMLGRRHLVKYGGGCSRIVCGGGGVCVWCVCRCSVVG